MPSTGRLLPVPAIHQSLATDTKITRHRITSFRCVGHAMNMGHPADAGNGIALLDAVAGEWTSTGA
jgi:hypothetical protein